MREKIVQKLYQNGCTNIISMLKKKASSKKKYLTAKQQIF